MGEILSVLGVITVCLFVIWLGAGLIIFAVDTLANKFHTTTFLVSYFVLGFLTSVTEISVAVNSFQQGVPQLSVGNLVGGIIVLFLCVVPVVGLLGKGLKLESHLSLPRLSVVLLILISPILALSDGLLTPLEGLLMILGYGVISWLMYGVHPSTNGSTKTIQITWKKLILALMSIGAGVLMIVISSEYLVDSSLTLAQLLGVAPFLISLLGLSIGTNVPELSLAIRAVMQGKKEVALGNYIGSAAFNIFILGVLTITNYGIPIFADYSRVALFLVSGLILFYLFMYTRKELSRQESLLLLTVYGFFIVTEALFI